MKIFLGSDHRGFEAKEEIMEWLVKKALPEATVVACGSIEQNPDDDYPDIAFTVADSVKEDAANRGIVWCGTGTGVLIAANKVDGIRCGFAASPKIVQAAREDDDINVLAIAADVTSIDDMKQMIMVFLDAQFRGGERYQHRLDKIAAREKTN